MSAWYNENNPEAAAHLRAMIAAGHIAPGIVDERSIEDVTPADLAPFAQCHFFAGIGVWSLALRAAGVADDYPIWSGSCPCQPFSEAGQGVGFDDERHLWPQWHYLITQCKPSNITGEQVASKNAGPWIDLVQTDLEALGYAFGAVPFPSAGIGAPHIRDRLYWFGRLADTYNKQYSRPTERAQQGGRVLPGAGCDHGGMEYTRCDTVASEIEAAHIGQSQTHRPANQPGGSGLAFHSTSTTGPVNGFWRAADWVFCRDGKWRPVEPGTQPLAYGMPRSMGAMSSELQRLAEVAGLSNASLKRAKAYRTSALRGYGNAINAEAARLFIECCLK